MNHQLEDASKTMTKFQQMVQRRNMRMKVSDHYVLMYGIPNEPAEHTGNESQGIGNEQSDQADRLLQLMENVYRGYFLKFAMRDEVLAPPTERLMVLLFNRQEDFVHYATMVDPNLREAAGFWAPASNIATFVDQASNEFHQSTQQHVQVLSDNSRELVRRHVKGSRDMVQYAATMEKLADIMRRQSEIAVVTHEATHQLAGNTGLMPRKKFALQWVHEGLATYFETPVGACWGGVGAVNAHRLQAYRAMRHDPEHSNIEFIVSDLIFAAALDQKATQAAYGQAWALTHFLMETRFRDLMTYYRRLAQLEARPGGVDRRELVDLFDDIFGEREALDIEWRAYMSSLQTDTQQLLIAFHRDS